MATPTPAHLSASQEDYLEAIYHISERKQAARAKDISTRLGVNNSSVTGALHALAQKGLVNYEPYDIVTLTDQGYAAAQQVVRRHEVLREFLVQVLDVAPEEAEESACKLEHAVSDTVLEKLVRFMADVPELHGRHRAGAS
ncbi:MAG TPA: metal-dependent transcriptional regulator [Spirochaetia bacterium]|nr:metal-dependent transcriptional regulator [Spirochaetia bacterium]